MFVAITQESRAHVGRGTSPDGHGPPHRGLIGRGLPKLVRTNLRSVIESVHDTLIQIIQRRVRLRTNANH
ncbi:uncharacterized protein CTRU02_207826 [Colletotrichum truncatum]|uniref:Uncharacterized protein n=1 Tax=Colletotrichum truncatum TaxID=5467 RepID=A0ACC3Z202_COLTU